MSTDSFYINISSPGSDTTAIFQPAIKCEGQTHRGYNFNGNLQEFTRKEWEVALCRCTFTNLVPNITAALGNNTLSYNNGTTDKSITIPDGQYSLITLNEYIQRVMKANGDYIAINPVADIYRDDYYVSFTPFIAAARVNLDIRAPYTVTLSSGLATFLGFTTPAFVAGYHTGSGVPFFNSGIQSFQVRCSLISGGSYNNDEMSDILLSFIPDTMASSIVSIVPEHRIYLPFNQSQINQITLRLTDQTNKSIDLRSDIQYVLHLRKRER